ncbi:MAG TPA: SDR family NAD(P)-dependent oxidoreductase [Solirubrobacterales bacterium]|jgi:NAD(P)-dependent dehydrogenase (short-subunit alcohol dehydrogenase family)|nr:SDR family NAD(P)-dependent oxidoreductase [Solirubrobacterales bacterium]
MTHLLDRALDLSVLPGYSRLGFRLRNFRWDDNVRDPILRDRVVLVTGGSSGLGEAACEGFAAAGARVHMLARDHDRAVRAIARIQARLPRSRGTVELELCDLSDLSEVRRFAESFQARFDQLDLLVNNAGVLTQERTCTPEGIELTFATNVLGPFLLTSLLLPALLAAAPARVITVSSGGMYTARLRPDDLQLQREPFDGARFYSHTKRAQVAINTVWAEQFAASQIAFHAMHPGWVDTPGLRASLPRFRRAMRPLLRDAYQGADTVVWLGTQAGLDPATGGFWHDRATRAIHRLPSTRETASDRARLWSECERLATEAPEPSGAVIC